MLKFFRLRYLILYLVAGLVFFYADLRSVAEGPLTQAIKQHLASMGFPNATFQMDELSFRALKLSNLKLDTDGINTIDQIIVTYSPLSMILGRANTVTITKPDLIFSREQFQTPADAPAKPWPTLSLNTLPFDHLTITDLNLSYAGDDMNPNLNGTITLMTSSEGQKKLLLNLQGEQKDFSVKIKGTATEEQNGILNLQLDIPEARLDMPELMLSRAKGQFDITYAPGGDLSAKGEWVAGAMRVGTVALSDVTLVASGRKPDFSLIGNASLSGVPETFVSLRATDDHDGAALKLQLSGTSPQKLMQQIWPTGQISWPGSQKFALTLDMQDTNFADLLRPPYTGGLFLYDDAPKPFISLGVRCDQTIFTCAVTLPPTTLSVPQINRFAAPLLADHGLSLTDGRVTAQGTWTNGVVKPVALQSDQLDFDWQGLAMTDTAFSVRSDDDGSWHVAIPKMTLFDGTVTVDPAVLTPDLSGRLKLSLDQINLEELSNFVQVQGLDMDGTASGTLPVTLERGVPKIDRGGTLKGLTGTLAYRPKQYPSFLAGQDDRMKILRESLTRYQFDQFTLDFTGDPLGTMTATLAAKGRNESLFGKRPIHINLNLDGPLVPALRDLLPYVTQGTNE